MWQERTPEEEVKWRKAVENDARSTGRFVGCMVWLAFSVLTAGGWYVFLSSGGGGAVRHEVAGSFWVRLPIFALLAAPFAYFVFRYETRKALRKGLARTICPKCDAAAESNAGAACQCGGTFVSTGAVKWVE